MNSDLAYDWLAPKLVKSEREALDVLMTEIAELRKDAERCHKIRRGQRWSVVNGVGDTLRAEALDAAVDSAPAVCGGCGGTGRMVRDPDIGTDQDCFVCEGGGLVSGAA